MLRAAELWSVARNTGTPTAHPEALDADWIVAAQALTLAEVGPGVTPIVATTNLAHMVRFPGISARTWDRVA